jgi:energy-coupling factor transporter ATP-binding protein EcfA2
MTLKLRQESGEMQYIVETKSVSKIYHSNDLTIRAVDRADIRINAGEFVALVGPSGSGKTTMLAMLAALLSPSEGLVNEAIKASGGEPIAFLYSPQWFRVVVIGSDIWKDTGWGTILYLAALMSIDPTLFEAAAVDGATRLQRIWHISLPGILGTIVVVTLLRLGNILDAGFQQIFVTLPVYSGRHHRYLGSGRVFPPNSVLHGCRSVQGGHRADLGAHRQSPDKTVLRLGYLFVRSLLCVH